MGVRDLNKVLVITNLINGKEFKIYNIGYIDNSILQQIINGYTLQWLIDKVPYKVDYYIDNSSI